MSANYCDKHGEGFGDPCYMCVDETNREQSRRIAALEAALRVFRNRCTSRSAVIAPELNVAAYVIPCEEAESALADGSTAALDAMLARAVQGGYARGPFQTLDDIAAIVQRVKDGA